MESWRRAGLEPPALEPQLRQALAQCARRVLADPAAVDLLLADMNQAVEKRAGRHDARTAFDPPSIRQLDRLDAPSRRRT